MSTQSPTRTTGYGRPSLTTPSQPSTALGNTIKRKDIEDPWATQVPPEDHWLFTYDDPDPTTCAAASADAGVEFDATSLIRAAHQVRGSIMIHMMKFIIIIITCIMIYMNTCIMSFMM